MCEVLDMVENAGYTRGKDDGLKQGLKQGERQTLAVMRFLINENRSEDLLRFAEDSDFRTELINELFPEDDD